MDCSIETTTPLVKSRRIQKPNSLIFTSENVVRMPQKKHAKKNVLLNNAIKTINRKTKLNNLNKKNLTKIKVEESKVKSGHNLKSRLNNRINRRLNNRLNVRLNGRLNGTSTVASNKITTKVTSNKIKNNKKTKRRYIKRGEKFDNDQMTNSSDDTESNSISNENKNVINLKSEHRATSINHALHHLFTKQPITKNGKIRGRPRKAIKIDSLLGIMTGGLNGGNGELNNNFKNVLERVHESHQNQVSKLNRQIEEKEKEKMTVEIKNASLIKENELLRERIENLINESQIRKELEDIKNAHLQEIRKIKKKRWCSNVDCEESASYFCCFNAFYCNLECQTRHWKLHRKSCRNKNRISNQQNLSLKYH